MNLLTRAAHHPYTVLRAVLGGPLHPGGSQATQRLLDQADVDEGDALVDLGCGPGEAVQAARERGARAVGLDERADGADVQARFTSLPLAEDAFDVVLAECSLCLAEDLDTALDEAARVLAPDGRLAFSDVTVDRRLPDVPDRVAELLCLDGRRGSKAIRERVQAAGFAIEHVDDRHEDLVGMRDAIREGVDVEGLLAALGERGQRLQRAVDQLEAALEAREIGYVSIIAQPR